MSNYAAPSAPEASLPKPDAALAALARLLARQAAAEVLAGEVQMVTVETAISDETRHE